MYFFSGIFSHCRAAGLSALLLVLSGCAAKEGSNDEVNHMIKIQAHDINFNDAAPPYLYYGYGSKSKKGLDSLDLKPKSREDFFIPPESFPIKLLHADPFDCTD